MLESALVLASIVDSDSKELVVMYSGFFKARKECSERPQLMKFLTPIVFLKLCRSGKDFVRLRSLMNYVTSKIQAERLDIQLKFYDMVGHGYLRECDLENLVNDLIPTMSGLSSLQEDFVQFYVYTAVRRFMFFHDPRRSGRIPINELVGSLTMQEFLASRDGVQPSSNWFSAEAAINVYMRYIEMDVDGNGMLSKAELLKYPSGLLTPIAVDRIFQEYRTYENEMDYKGFLDLVLALENKNTEASLRYMWKVLDEAKTGQVNKQTLELFLGSVISTLIFSYQSAQASQYKVCDLFDEVCDILGLKDQECLTFSHLKKHNGALLPLMLIDAQAFFLYDNRESYISAQVGS